MNLEWIRSLPVDGLTKGFPATAGEVRQDQIGAQGWNVLREDLPFPLAVIGEDVMTANRAWMRAFIAQSGADICPHGKTTMSPELFALQMEDGAFGMTCASASHLEVYRRAGVKRVILANQLVGRTNLEMALRHLRDPEFDLYCLADSQACLKLLAETSRTLGLARPVQTLIEIGSLGARTGVRTIAEAIDLARYAGSHPELVVSGVETYEGVFAGRDPREREGSIRGLLDLALEASTAIAAIAPRGSEPFILSAGGSDFFDLVVERFTSAALGRPVRIVLRGGCYLTHDSAHYARCFDRMRERSPHLTAIPGGLKAALVVWAVVQSRPEPTRAYCAVGKRDISYDWELPQPVSQFRRERDAEPVAAPASWRTLLLNDQHLHLEVDAQSDIGVGDLIAFGVSHPCTTFDKWKIIPLVNGRHTIVDAVRTFF